MSAEMREKVRVAVKAVLTYGEELKTLLGSKPPKLKEAQTLQAETGFLGQAIARLADALVGAPCKRLLAACFCAGTLLRTHGGLQAIETLKVGDRVLSRDEHDRSSVNDYKVVEEVFERLGRVWHLTAGGRLIRTTGEHPFQEVTKGWIACFQLAAGDRLVCEDGSTVLVEAVVDTGTVEVVYNLRVADWHTYFVGGEDWGFAVWAHNAYASPVNGTDGYAYPASVDTAVKQAAYRRLIGGSVYTEYRRKHLQARTVEAAIRYSRSGDAQYSPEFAINNTNNGLERTALMHGFIVDHGGSYFAYIKFDKVVGYDGGKPTYWIRAEVSKSSPFTRHGHPMSESRLPQAVRDHFGL
ncbi:MAG: HINT domain-containing protein [Bacteroidales bacterium]|nr:HINT domain-containing protein [Bacteroidales bacterium]